MCIAKALQNSKNTSPPHPHPETDWEYRKMWPNFLAVVSLLCLAFFAWAKAGPVPIVNEVSGRQGADGARRKRSSTAGGTNLGQ